MKINKVDLKHFKGIDKASINFGDLTVITGKNSSGKSSVIQSLKYLTQWFKVIRLTKGLDEFSAPSLQITHPNFIVENKDYESIRNSKSPPSEGITLGVELLDDSVKSSFNQYGQYSISAEFENISQERNKVRPRSITLSIPEHWNEERGTFVDEKFDFIYHDVNSSLDLKRKQKYIEQYGSGQLLDRVFNDDKYIGKERDFSIVDTSKKHYLHMVGGNYETSAGPKDRIMESLQNVQLGKDKAFIINSQNERLSFDNSSGLKIIKYEGSKNVFFDLFADYILNPLENTKVTSNNPFEEDEIDELLTLITKIYHSNAKNRALLAEYLHFDVKSRDGWADAEYAEMKGLPKDIDDQIINGLNADFISEKKIAIKVMKNFQALTDVVNSSKYPEQAVGAVQILLMFVDYLNNLAKSKNALNFSRFMEELTSSNSLFDESLPDSIFKNPINTIVEIQNCLGKSAEYMGVSWTSKQDGTLDCNCDAPTAYNVFSNELLRELNPWDVVRNCPDGINVGGHIYTLTAADELDKNEPNSYTLRPKAHLRGGNFSVESFLNELKKVVLKQSTESFELYFSILNNDLLKSESYYSRCLTFLKARNEISELRESILQLEDLDREYAETLEEAYGDYAEAQSQLKALKTQDTDVDFTVGTTLEMNLADEIIDDGDANNDNVSRYFDSEDEEYMKILRDDDLDRQMKNLQRSKYKEAELQSEIEAINEYRDSVNKQRQKINENKLILMGELNAIEESNDFISQEWDVQLINNIESLMNTSYVSVNPVGASDLNLPHEIEVDSLSEDLQYLNTGRDPSSGDYPGEFYANLPVGKIGGLLTDLIYEEGETEVYPFLFPSFRESSDEEYVHSRNFNDLNWYTTHPEDEHFLPSFNMWISYLSMEVNKVTSEIEGPNPRLKVTGKDGKERDVFEVGSGIGQVLPVIAICLLAKPGEVVCIEEPEAHLHPSAQAYLADFLLAMAASGRQIIVETHSPNIIDRLRLRRVHHKSWKKFKNKEWMKSELHLDDVENIDKKYIKFKEPDMKIIFAEQNNDGFSTYKEAAIDRKGDIIFGQSQDEIWPDGFFDNAQQELSYILKARISAEEE